MKGKFSLLEFSFPSTIYDNQILMCHGQSNFLLLILLVFPFYVKGYQSPCEVSKISGNQILSDSSYDNLIIAELMNLSGYRTFIPSLNNDSWEIGLDLSYTNGNSIDYFGGGLMTKLSAGKTLQINGVPVILGGGLVLRDGVWDRRNSTVRLQLDHQKIMETYLNNQRILSEKAAYSKLSNADKELLISRILVNQATDSIKNNYKAGSGIQRDSCLILYDSLLKKNAENIEKVKALSGDWKRQTEGWKSEVSQLANDGIYKKDRIINSKKSSLFQFLLPLKALKVGSFRTPSSGLSMTSIPLQGGSFDYYRNNIFASFSIGKEVSQRSFSSALSNQFLRNISLGREMVSTRLGYGKPEGDHLHINFTKTNQKAVRDDTLTFPVNVSQNIVVGFDYSQKLSKSIGLLLEGGASSSDIQGQERLGSMADRFFSNGSGLKNKYYLSGLTYRPNKKNAQLMMGYQAVGNEFISLANPFLISGRQGVRIEAKLPFKKDRIILKARYIHHVSNNQSGQASSNINHNLCSAELTWRITKKGSKIWAQYSPNYFAVNNTSESGGLYQNNLVTIGAQLMHPLSKTATLINIIQLTNFSDQTRVNDTLTTTGILYCFTSSSLILTKYSTSLNSSIGLDQKENNRIAELNVEALQSFAVARSLRFTQSFNILKRQFDLFYFWGGSLGADFHYKSNSIGMRGLYLTNPKPESKAQFQLQLNYVTRF